MQNHLHPWSLFKLLEYLFLFLSKNVAPVKMFAYSCKFSSRTNFDLQYPSFNIHHAFMPLSHEETHEIGLNYQISSWLAPLCEKRWKAS